MDSARAPGFALWHWPHRIKKDEAGPTSCFCILALQLFGHPPHVASVFAMSDRLKRAREIAVRTKPRFIEIPREKRSSVPFTKEQLTGIRGGLTAEEYRWKLIREWCED
jgi:hypothetical protein